MPCPTLIVQQDSTLTPICTGCEPLTQVRAALDACLAATVATPRDRP